MNVEKYNPNFITHGSIQTFSPSTAYIERPRFNKYVTY